MFNTLIAVIALIGLAALIVRRRRKDDSKAPPGSTGGTDRVTDPRGDVAEKLQE